MKLPKLIGVIQLPPLAGAPQAHGHHPVDALQMAGGIAVQEAQALAQAGFDGVLIQNFGDSPYFRTQAPPETIASLAIIVAAVREAIRIQVGVQVLRNDARAALAIASVTGCDFIRASFPSGEVMRDPALAVGEAAFLLREREKFHTSVAIFGDFPFQEMESYFMLDGAVITGLAQDGMSEGFAFEPLKQMAREFQLPLYLENETSRDKLKELMPMVDGMIVGSALRKGAVGGAKLDTKIARQFALDFAKTRRKKNSTPSVRGRKASASHK